MHNQSSANLFRITVFTITAFFIAFAFIHSSMPADLSGNESEIVKEFLQYILNLFGFGFQLTDYIVRKTAHFTEYTAIGFMLMTCAYSLNRTNPCKYYIYVLFTGLAAAVCDETIQLNVVGRSGQLTDVLLDFSGIVTGSLILLAVFKIFRKIKNK